jgi:hypothetical protein
VYAIVARLGRLSVQTIARIDDRLRILLGL